MRNVIGQYRRTAVRLYWFPDEKALMREFGNLEQIKDNYPKHVVSMDEMFSISDYEGIKHLHIKEFFMGSP